MPHNAPGPFGLFTGAFSLAPGGSNFGSHRSSPNSTHAELPMWGMEEGSGVIWGRGAEGDWDAGPKPSGAAGREDLLDAHSRLLAELPRHVSDVRISH